LSSGAYEGGLDLLKEFYLLGELYFLGPDEITVVGHPQELVSLVVGGWSGGSWVVVFLDDRNDDRRYWLFDGFARVAIEFSSRGRQGGLDGIIAAAGRPAVVVPPGVRPTGPAVVLDGTRVVAVWFDRRPRGIEVGGDDEETPPESLPGAPLALGKAYGTPSSSPVPPPPARFERSGGTRWARPRRRRSWLGLRRKGRAAQAGAGPVGTPIGPPASAVPQTSLLLRRTPHLDVRPGGELAPSAPVTVEVWCDEHAARPGEYAESVEIEAPADRDRFELRVWIVCSEHFSFVQPCASLELRRSHSTSRRVHIEGCVSDAPPPGPGRISAMFAYRGRPAGMVTRSLSIGSGADGGGEPSPGPLLDAGGSLPESAGVPPDTDGRVVVDPTARDADLVIHVVEVADDERQFNCAFSTSPALGIDDPEPEEWRLDKRAAEMVADYMEDFTSEGLSAEERVSRLRGAGIELFKVAPKGFRDLLWRMIEEGRPPRSILVVSDDWVIPWELMVPNRPRAGGGLEMREPLGVECAVGRWVTSDHISPPQSLPLIDSRTFAPAYQGSDTLKHAEDEIAFVRKRFPGDRIEPGKFKPLAKFKGGRAVNLLHLVCHGEASRNGSQAIKLEGKSKLFSHQLATMKGLSRAVGDGRPLVFMNACEVGRPQPALVGVGGFAVAFLELGAGAVLAPLWSVEDGIAHEVATDFYEGVIAKRDRPFAEILQEIRRKAYAENEGADTTDEGLDSEDDGLDTYAAYCFYGDPLASAG
jgi:CHAT domain-containing protein